MAQNKLYQALGMMSGTSMDGIDIALMRSDGQTVEGERHHITIPYAKNMRVVIQNAMTAAKNCAFKDNSVQAIMDAEQQLTALHCDAISTFLATMGISANDIDVIGVHGQTIVHCPDDGWTWQLMDGAAVANRFGITTVSDFRSNDMRHGGQGAPLVPLYHHALLASQNITEPVAVLNIGGVANVTWLDFSEQTTSQSPTIIAFDTGPGNAPLDDWAMRHMGQPCDLDGALAKKGTVDRGILQTWLANSYFQKKPPKTLDRDTFSYDLLETLSAENGAATLVAFIVESIGKATAFFPKAVSHWYVCGGGRHNPVLMEQLAKTLDGKVSPVEGLGWNGDALEAEAFAFLAVRALKGLALTQPSTTGVKTAVSGGVIHSA